MISAARAYLISKNTACDMNVVKTELANIENKIVKHAKEFGATSLKYKIDISVPKKNLFATYAKLIKRLRASCYCANIQTEKYRVEEEEFKLLKSDNEMEKHFGWLMFESRQDKCGTYLYISWDNHKEND